MSLLNSYFFILSLLVVVCIILTVIAPSKSLSVIRRAPLKSIAIILTAWLVGLFAFGALNQGKSDIEISFLRRSDANEDALVFLHGWIGDSSTWDPLLTVIKADPRFSTFDLVSIDYPTKKPFDQTLTLDDLAPDIESVLSANMAGRNLFIVAHSTGGVLARQILIRQNENGSTLRVKRLVAIASPFGGTNTASLASHLGVSQELLVDLRDGSRYLLALHTKWNDSAEAIVQSGYRELCIASKADVIVPHKSAITDCRDVFLFDSWEHTNIHAPLNLADQRYHAIITGIHNESR